MAKIDISFKSHRDLIVGDLAAKYSVDGRRILRYYIDFRHKVLDLHKELSAPELSILQNKVDALLASWDKKFEEHQRRSKLTSGKEAAEQLTIEATERLASILTILAHTLSVNDRVDWETLKEKSSFAETVPVRKKISKPIQMSPKITFWDTLFGRKQRKLFEAKSQHEHELLVWNEGELRRDQTFKTELASWNQRQEDFLKDQAAHNANVNRLAEAVAIGEPQAVIEHATIVVDSSDYDDLFEKSFDIDYSPSEKTILIEYELPSPDQMPSVKNVRFVNSTGEIKETYISDKEHKSNFDSACYQICLRTIHELFEADEFHNIDHILFNGFATYIDKSIGKDVRSCIMSILVGRASFEAIDLSRVDPKACFKSLKGVSASTLSVMAPIPPILEMNREDKRFIEGRSVEGLSDATNLAAMDWEDFEHLVREVFEREFAARGGEVKITQSSSDGGVDAVAFDPDPITGGKIVIQAKRYTRTVGVSAVRDLYGTMQHESASRGILVTTADYGPDAHKFSAGKPITLLTGSNLLHLLEKHGYKAKIDLREARKELNLRDYG